MRIVGIDIGSYSIKVAELETALKSVNLRDFYEIELTHELGQDVRLEKIEALRRIAAQYDPSVYRIVVGLGSEAGTQRILTFPFLERRKILQSLPFELEDAIPFSQEEAIFDFRIINQKESASQVLAFAVPKKYVQETLMLCDDAGLDPDIVSLDGIALANLFEGVNLETTVPGGAELIIHIGYSKTIINVIQYGNLLASRALFFGGKDMASSVSRAYQLPYLDALKGVAEKGFVLTSQDGVDDNQKNFSDVIVQSLNPLLVDLKRTMVDLKAEFQVEFTRGYITGGMSRLLNLGPFLTSALELHFEVFHHLGVSTKTFLQDTESTDKASSVATGLALEGLRKPSSPAINLRKNEFSKNSQKFKMFWENYHGGAKLALALIIAFYVYSPLRVMFLEDDLTAVDKALKEQAKNPILNIATSQLKTESLKRFISAKKEELQSRKEVLRLNRMSSALDIMKTLSIVAPKNGQVTVDVRHINIDGDNLLLEGLVNNKAEYDFLQKSIMQSPLFSQVKGGQPSFIPPPSKFAFQLNMNVSRISPVEKRGK